MTISTFRENARNACLRYCASLQLTRSIRPDQRTEIEDWLAALERLSGPELRRQWKRIAQQIDATLRWYGVKGSLSQLQQLVASAEEKPDQVFYVRKGDLARLFTRYERALITFPKLPPHALIGLDVNGLIGGLSWHLLEAALFEDLAALWNISFELREKVFPSPPHEVKRELALQRSTLRAAYNLIEGYLNGMAADCILIYGSALTPKERSQLLEFDEQKKRRRYLTLRDKLLQYPKIAARSTDPPVHESSCIEMKGLLALEDAIRHALIHPDVKIRGRQIPFMELDLELVRAVVDDTIQLIRTIAAELPDQFGDVNIWLFERKPDGFFADSAFT